MEQDIVYNSPEWANQTTVHPLGLLITVILGIATLCCPRRFALLPIILMACFIAPAQRVVILELDFSFLRLMVIAGWIRILFLRDTPSFQWKPVDTVFCVWIITKSLAYNWLHASVKALIFTLGDAFDAVGMYFMFRHFVQSWSDLDGVIKCFIIASIPVSFAFLIERATGRNAFSVFGGVPAITVVREGKLRCQGAFSHPILAGCFWASVMPLMASRWWRGGSDRLLAVIGLVAAGLIIFACSSSTPLMGVVFGMIGALAFLLRRSMRLVRWGILLGLIGLHMVMKKPVWHLIARIDVVGGSTGWHRYHLIDQAINRVGEWGLRGTIKTAHWGYHLFDVTNQYVAEGVRGGLLTVILFIILIAKTFGGVGSILRQVVGDRAKTAAAWALGVTMLVHTTNFLAVTYFGQIIVVWYLTLAMVAGLSTAKRPAPQPQIQFERSRQYV